MCGHINSLALLRYEILGCFVDHFVDLFDFFEFLKDMKIKRNVCHFVLGSM